MKLQWFQLRLRGKGASSCIVLLLLGFREDVKLRDQSAQKVDPDLPVVPAEVEDCQEGEEDKPDASCALGEHEEAKVEVEGCAHLGEDRPEVLVVKGVDGLLRDDVCQLKHLGGPKSQPFAVSGVLEGFFFVPVAWEVILVVDIYGRLCSYSPR